MNKNSNKKTRRSFVKCSVATVAGLAFGSQLFYGCIGDSGHENKVPELIVDIDFNDEVAMRPEPITESEVREMVNDLNKSGVQVLLVRMGFLGYLPYRTNLSYPIAFDEEHFRSHPLPYFIPKDSIEKNIEKRRNNCERYRKVIEDFNPPEVFISEAHNLGMKVIIWLDIFDNMFPGYRSKFIDENPHCLWTARDGETKFEGLVSYAWPEAREFCVAQAKELLALGADGIHCSTSAHCRHLPNVQQDDFYGYEQPVVDEYKKRFGIDIRTAPTFDKEAWHTIKGEFMNQLYRDLATVCHQQNKELWIGLQLGEYTHISVDTYFSKNVVARYKNLWKEMVEEGIADAFIIGDYEQCSHPEREYWEAKKDIKIAPDSDLYAWAANYYQPTCNRKTKLYLFGEWLSGSAGTKEWVDKRLEFFANHIHANHFNGIDVHEAADFEKIPNGMDLLKRMSQRLKKEELSPL